MLLARWGCVWQIQGRLNLGTQPVQFVAHMSSQSLQLPSFWCIVQSQKHPVGEIDPDSATKSHPVHV